MTSRRSILLGALLSVHVAAQSKRLSLTMAEGGRLNDSSSLKRRWFTLNDATCPIELYKVGIQSGYEGFSSVYKGDGVLTFSRPARAYEVILVLFDVWGERVRNLSRSEVRDVEAKGELLLEGTWIAQESEAARVETIVAFVDRVLLADGSLWRADRAAIIRQLDEVQLRLPDSWISDDGSAEMGKRV